MFGKMANNTNFKHDLKSKPWVDSSSTNLIGSLSHITISKKNIESKVHLEPKSLSNFANLQQGNRQSISSMHLKIVTPKNTSGLRKLKERKQRKEDQRIKVNNQDVLLASSNLIGKILNKVMVVYCHVEKRERNEGQE